MRVFNISPHRSGTRSFHAFCLAHDLRSAHWPDAAIDQACAGALETLDAAAVWAASAAHFGSASVFSDLPCPLVYRQVFAAEPEARFVLVTRDVAGWRRSVRAHAAGRDLSFMEKFFYWSACGERHGRIEAYSDAALDEGYRGFVAEAPAWLRGNGAEIGVFDLASPTLTESLAGFLGFAPRQRFGRIAG